jgi:Lipoprotein LpqB beta-propeller domain/Sporulation and spore germination
VGRRAGAAALCLAVVLISGCAGIPTSGPVVEGESVPEQLPVSVGFVANPPAPSASETEIVQGYLEAMASYEPGYPTAAQFLTPDAESAWDPATAMTIYTVSPTVSQTGPRSVRLTMSVEAVIAPDVGFERRAPVTTTEIDLALDQVDGEWRIVNPPTGLLISDQDFASEFREYNTYYFDPEFEVLVPDPVYIPIQGNVPKLLTEALLRGPSRWLAPAVRTAFPDGTELGLPVTVEAGQAQVELTAEAAGGTPEEQREQITAQLAWTLDQVDGVQQVVVRADGLPLTDASATAGPGDSFPELDPRRPLSGDLYAVSESGVVVGAELTPVAGPLGEFPGARELAVDPRVARAAVVDPTGTQLLWAPLDRDTTVSELATGSNLVSVSWDRTGLVWTVDRAAGGSTVIVSEPGAAPVTVPTPSGLVGRDIGDLAVSPDGSRIALLLGGDVQVGIVVRGDTGVGIEGMRPVQIGDRVVTAVGWSTTTELAVLAEEPGDTTEPFRVSLGGSRVSPAGPVADAVDLAAAPGHGLAVSTADGTLFRQDATLRWVELGAAMAPAYPG